MMIEEAKPVPVKWRKLMIQGLLGGMLGFVGAFGMSSLIEAGVLGTLDASQEIALVWSMVYVAIGLLVGGGMAVPRAGAQLLNFEDEGELREQRRVMAWSAVSMVVMGLLLALLALAAPGGPVPAWVALAAILLFGAALTWASFHILGKMDELMRSVTRECGEAAYYLLLLTAGGWATLAYLGYAPAMGMLDFLTLNYAVLLAASFIASGRRGLLRMK